MTKLDDYLASFETRAKAAIALVYDPAKEPTYPELIDREATMARQYLRDVGELTQLVRESVKREALTDDLLRSVTFNPKEPRRRSGRTTRMLLRGLIALSEGHPVLVVAHTSEYAKTLRRQLVSFAKVLQIPFAERAGTGELPYVVGKGVREERTGFRGYTLIDHEVCGGEGRIEVGEQPPPFEPEIAE